MNGHRRTAPAQRGHGEHLRKTLRTLGVVLLVAVATGLASEISLHTVQAPEVSGFSDISLRHTLSLALMFLQAALPVVAALVAAPVLVAGLLHDLHGTSSINEAHERVNHLLFGALGVERRAQVSEGRLQAGDDGVVERAGGPATLTVYGDSAAVTEQDGKLKRLLTTGVYTLDRYERIWETVDLRPQRWVRKVFALTKEGIPISCDVDILFQIDDLLEGESSSEGEKNEGHEAFAPYSEEALLQAATSRWIRRPHRRTQSLDWADRVATLVESALRDILATYRLDWLIRAPQSEQQHPRDEIRQRLKAELESHVDKVGAKLLDIEMGQIRVEIQEADSSEDEQISETLSDIISGQWIDAWHANWKARALTSRAEGEAELLRMDTARIQAQAEMIIGLAEILQPIVASDRTYEPYILALRLVQALRQMSYDPKTRDYMPPEAIRTLRRLQQLLDNELPFPEATGDTQAQGEEA